MARSPRHRQASFEEFSHFFSNKLRASSRHETERPVTNSLSIAFNEIRTPDSLGLQNLDTRAKCGPVADATRHKTINPHFI